MLGGHARADTPNPLSVSPSSTPPHTTAPARPRTVHAGVWVAVSTLVFARRFFAWSPVPECYVRQLYTRQGRGRIEEVSGPQAR